MDATNWRRRDFLRSAAALGLGAGLGPVAALRAITPASGAAMAVGPEAVRFRPEIEPVVRWIEETPRDRILDEAVDRLAAGLSYRELLAGLFLAGIRNVKPRPVGFKFHAVLVINSAHLLGQTAAVDERLLPLFWALDNFKGSQARDEQEGDWTLSAVADANLPAPDRAQSRLVEAFEAWDADAADSATAALCRSAGAARSMEPFWACAVRDWRNIGHKPIFAMQCWRTLQAVGWPNAEPVLRSLAFGLLDPQGDRDPKPVGPYAGNLELAGRIGPDWTRGQLDAGASRALLATLRQADPNAASAEVARMLGDGVAPGSLWDGILLGASELLVRQPGIIALHAVTAANALHFISGNAADETTRKLALLQAAGWLPLYRNRLESAGPLAIDELEPVEPAGNHSEAVATVFEAIGQDRRKAAAMALGVVRNGGSDELFAAARRMIFHKGNDSHDYKYGAAAWEEFTLASDPATAAPLAAAMTAHLPAASDRDSPLMERAREAVARLDA